MNNTTKRYLISSLVSFMAGFAATLIVNLDSITLQTILDGSYVGILFLAIRAGVKALLEMIIANVK